MADRKTMWMFVDGNNFYKSTSELFGHDVNVNPYLLFQGVRDLFRDNYYRCFLERAFYCSALSDREDNPKVFDDHKKFLDFVDTIPFATTVRGYLAKRPKHKSIPIDVKDENTYYHIEKETDVNLSNEMLESAFQKKCDVCLLFSADSDYSDTLTRLRKYKLDIYVVAPEGAPLAKLESIVGSKHIIRLSKEFLRPLIWVKRDDNSTSSTD